MNSIALVDAWEDGRRRSRIERPLILLTASQPGTHEEEWANLPVGKRDAQLLRLHEELFGTQLSAAANCPNCGEMLDISLKTEDIRISPRPECSAREFEMKHGKVAVKFRLPTTADLCSVAKLVHEKEPRKLLLERCILEVSKGGVRTDPLSLTDPVLQSIGDKMGEADPQAIVDLAMDCPACSQAWSLPFDISSYLWNEVEDLVQRLFRETHALAKAYGWSEREILGMSPLRRRVYLDMVEG